MPTMPASGEIASFIIAARASTRRSGSGSKALMRVGVVEVALEDDGGGERVHVLLGADARVLLAHLRFGLGGGQRLVDESDREVEAAREAAAEFLRKLCDRVLATIGVARAADDERLGAPIQHQLLDQGEA